MLDVSGAAVLQGALPHCQVTVLDSCGHSVALERPRKAAKLITDFLSEQAVSDGNVKKVSWRKTFELYADPWPHDDEGEEKYDEISTSTFMSVKKTEQTHKSITLL